ncbi:leukotriene A-4 hydrolase/aminopeptidase [Phytophthora cinnamomi]|uniref:leukotriene A-4 hydrolase/aminopeptidase n=1 Tax=Phytophthora cinnamomi TaxID=4785 RepID=UPI00355948EF|nr:leukotriene A-4 hydrolase/aminopeptidase [Phytophthora cinnamomi]
MAFFKLRKTEAEKAQQRVLKELERVAKAQRKHVAQEQKAQRTRLKQQQKEAARAEKQARKSRQRAVQTAKKASKTRIRLARKAERRRRQMRRSVEAAPVPPFSKSAGCSVCGKKFGGALHRRRHHCRQCRESCCLQCTSRTRRPVPRYGLRKPQKVCVVCETLVFSNAARAAAPATPREPAEAVVALAASGRASRRPHSAPLPSTDGVTVAMPPSTRGRGRPTKSKGGSIWTLPIRPLLKRKKSAEQLRNRKLDLDLQIDKRLLFRGRAVELQPQAVAPPAP